jgi:RNA polymerase sigma-32 factor
MDNMKTSTTPIATKLRSTKLLDAETEMKLATAWRENGDRKALDQLISAYFRYANSQARKFKSTGIPHEDLVQEAVIGLVKAAEKFDPSLGYRFSTYSRYWILATLRDYTIRNRGMVRSGTTKEQKKLFFNLVKVRNDIERRAAADGKTLDTTELHEAISDRLNVTFDDVVRMDAYLRQDQSLNAPMGGNQEDTGMTWLDALQDNEPDPAKQYEQANLDQYRAQVLNDAMKCLNPRELAIVVARKMSDDPRTLECLGREYQVSKERIRQLEAGALQKIKARLTSSGQANLLLVA